MFGDNIGTCITAQLASVRGNVHARRTAWAHTLYNIIGVLIAWITLPWFVKAVALATDYLQPGGGISAQIANSHTIFNVLSAVIFLPLTGHYVKFLETVIRSKAEDAEVNPVFTDPLLLDTPVAAMKAAISETARTATIARRMFDGVMQAFYNNDTDRLDRTDRDEQTLNDLQKQVTQYIVEISKRPLDHTESAMIPILISGINNVERVGDHSLSLAQLAREKMDKNLFFSKEALDDLRGIQSIIFSMFDLTIHMLETADTTAMPKVSEMEATIDGLSRQVQAGHAKRLEEGKCTIESGLIFLDVINYLERIADHVYKVCMTLGEFGAGL
jgi:phosphate:Na+ symporter